MGLFDFLKRKSEIIQEEPAVETCVEKTQGFIQDAEKVADVVAEEVKKGDLSNIDKRLAKFLESKSENTAYVFKTDSGGRYKIAILLSVVLTLLYIFILVIGIGIGVFSSAYRITGVVIGLAAIAIIVIDILLLRTSFANLKFNKRYLKYYEILKNHLVEITEDISYLTEIPQNNVIKDLSKAIKNGLIPQGHFGTENFLIIMSDDVFSKYCEKPAVYDKYYQELLNERKRLRERPEEVDQLLSVGKGYVDKIHEYNDLIKDKDISDKLDRMEATVATIFREIEFDPTQINKLGMFINYYLPTTENLLEEYCNLDNKQIKGKSIKETQKEISNALNSINIAYENLLDRFFREKELDVSSDIAAMESMMEQDGLH